MKIDENSNKDLKFICWNCKKELTNGDNYYEFAVLFSLFRILICCAECYTDLNIREKVDKYVFKLQQSKQIQMLSVRKRVVGKELNLTRREY